LVRPDVRKVAVVIDAEGDPVDIELAPVGAGVSGDLRNSASVGTCAAMATYGCLARC
jgi:hypothetical protein